MFYVLIDKSQLGMHNTVAPKFVFSIVYRVYVVINYTWLIHNEPVYELYLEPITTVSVILSRYELVRVVIWWGIKFAWSSTTSNIIVDNYNTELGYATLKLIKCH